MQMLMVLEFMNVAFASRVFLDKFSSLTSKVAFPGVNTAKDGSPLFSYQLGLQYLSKPLRLDRVRMRKHVTLVFTSISFD